MRLLMGPGLGENLRAPVRCATSSRGCAESWGTTPATPPTSSTSLASATGGGDTRAGGIVDQGARFRLLQGYLMIACGYEFLVQVGGERLNLPSSSICVHFNVS